MTTDRVNHINIALMAVSATLAYLFPFGLFLVAYAILGPLHYLTEISWLHDRGYFTRRRTDVLFLVGIALGVTALFLGLRVGVPTETAIAFCTFVAFAAALIFAFVQGWTVRIIAILAALLLAVGISLMPTTVALFGLFLPTLVHVFLFTGIFILAGAIKSRSRSGFLSLALFLAIPVALFLIPPGGYEDPGKSMRDAYGTITNDGRPSRPFVWVNYFAARALQLTPGAGPDQTLAGFVAELNEFLYSHPTALALMAFIAFAYTYHYLNWFSKTSIIRWHEVPRHRIAAILAIWAASLSLFAFDYGVGLGWLFLLSFLHVVLEFPLNHVTVAGLFK